MPEPSIQFATIFRGLIRFFVPVVLATAGAGFAARAIYHNTSAQAVLLVVAGTVAGAILGAIWVIKHVEQDPRATDREQCNVPETTTNEGN
jgi:hypothetical protein